MKNTLGLRDIFDLELKDHTLWFKKNPEGSGWVPAHAYGWVCVGLYILALSLYPILTAPVISRPTYGAIVVFSTLALYLVALIKGEKI